MELANIEKLVEKYLNATTTLKEETTLQEYFLSDNVALHLQEYQYMFSYFKNSKEQIYTKTIELKPKKTKKVNFKWLSVAASVLLLLSSVFIGKQEYDKYQKRKQYAQVKNTLLMISKNLNKGNDALYAVSKNLNKGKQSFKELYAYESTVDKVLNKIKK